MSSALSICRACLARNSRMYTITNPELQATFEKLSGSTLVQGADGAAPVLQCVRDVRRGARGLFLHNHAQAGNISGAQNRGQLQQHSERVREKLITKEGGKPNTICYICFALLHKCWKFRRMSREANKHIIKFYCNSLPQPAHNITLDDEIKYTLSIAKTKYTSISHDYLKDENSEVTVKEETTVIGNNVATERDLAADITGYERTGSMSPKQEWNSTEHKNAVNTHNESSNTSKSIVKEIQPITEPNSIASRNLRKIYSCETCHKKFKQFTNLQTHIARHKQLKPFSCVKCFETFINQKELQKHVCCDVTRELHVCDICSKAYVSKYSLKVHKAHKHLKSAGKTYNCDTCNKAFNHRGTLRLHMRIHSGDRPYSCDMCPKSFSQKGTLLRHNRMHTGEKPFACHKCTKTFNQESSLKRHIKMHNGERAYACSRCDKAYYESSHLTRHMRTHTGEKPYACDRCFQTFSQSSNLHAHMKKHTGKKPSNFTCYECSKTFDHKSIYNRHLLKHTQEKPYPCDQCDKKYADKRTLRRHVSCHSQNI